MHTNQPRGETALFETSSTQSFKDSVGPCCWNRCHSYLIGDTASTRRVWSLFPDLLPNRAYCSARQKRRSIPPRAHHSGALQSTNDARTYARHIARAQMTQKAADSLTSDVFLPFPVGSSQEISVSPTPKNIQKGLQYMYNQS